MFKIEPTPYTSRYPFAELQAGQSFFVEASKKRPETVRMAVARYNKAHGTKLRARAETGGIRVFRTE